MNKKVVLLAILLIVFCSLFGVSASAMGGPAPSPSEGVEIIERIATQSEEALLQEKYSMEVVICS